MQDGKHFDRLCCDIAASPDPTGPDRLVAGYVRADPFTLTDADRERIAAYKARAIAGAMRMIGGAFAKPELPERLDEFTGTCCCGGSQCVCGGGE